MKGIENKYSKVGGRRKRINKQIREDIALFWRYYPRNREVTFIDIKEFEGYQDSRIQVIAHNWVKNNNLIAHSERNDIKRALRKYLREQLRIYFELNKIKHPIPDPIEDEEI